MDDYLPGSGPERQAALLELIRVDLACRLQAGLTVCVKDYLQRYPELRRDVHGVLDLVEVECRHRPARETPKDLASNDLSLPPSLRDEDLAKLNARWRAIFKLRSGQPPLTKAELETVLPQYRDQARTARARSLREVGKLMAVSKERIRQIEQRIWIILS